MSRLTHIGALAVAATVSCSETNYYIGRTHQEASDVGAGGMGGDYAPLASSSAEASTTTTGGGSGGNGGEGGRGSVSTSTASASASVSSSVSAASASSGTTDTVDCATAPIHAPCGSGVCARDGVCRPWIRCKTRRAGWERTVDCSDPNVDSISMWNNGGPQFSYSGCRHQEPRPDDTYKPMACVTGDNCSVQLKDWSGWPSDGNYGKCE